jgi:hypothetical protein
MHTNYSKILERKAGGSIGSKNIQKGTPAMQNSIFISSIKLNGSGGGGSVS